MRSLLALLIMLLLPLFLFWLPVPGLAGLIAGGIGGYLAGRPIRAVLLAMLPFAAAAAVIMAVALGAGFGTGLPLVGFIGSAIAGLAAVWLIAHHLALLLGAFFGGYLYLRNHGGASPRLGPPQLPAAEPH